MIKIIDYKAGNAPSVLNAVKRLGYEASLCKNPAELENATHIILPGVGSAGATMQSLYDEGFLPTLSKAVLTNKVPYLGICVGMQILFMHSQEEDTNCLGWIQGRVTRFDSEKVRVPQMGWNLVEFNDVTDFSPKKDYFYFVNSFFATALNQNEIWGVASYGHKFVAAIKKDNIYGTQFHIEKSGSAGLKLLDGFIKAGGKLC